MDKYKLKDEQTKNHFIWEVYNSGYKTGKLTREQCGEICNKELGLDFDESAFRKKYEAFESMWEEVKSEYLIQDDEELVDRLYKIEEAEDNLYKTKVRTADKLREYRKTLRDEARIENLVDLISHCIKSVPQFKVDRKKIS